MSTDEENPTVARDDAPGPSQGLRRLDDVAELRALAHPLRLSIIEHLSVAGPMTATQLGDALGESPANCSWHLRKLAEHDFVEEAGGGTGRQRPWRMTRVGVSWGESDTPETRIAGEELTGLVLRRWVQRYEASRARLVADPDPTWRRASSAGDSATWLTPEELRGLNDEISAVMMRHRDRLTDPSLRPPGSRLCEFVAWGGPSGLDLPAAAPAEPSDA